MDLNLIRVTYLVTVGFLSRQVVRDMGPLAHTPGKYMINIYNVGLMNAE